MTMSCKLSIQASRNARNDSSQERNGSHSTNGTLMMRKSDKQGWWRPMAQDNQQTSFQTSASLRFQSWNSQLQGRAQRTLSSRQSSFKTTTQQFLQLSQFRSISRHKVHRGSQGSTLNKHRKHQLAHFAGPDFTQCHNVRISSVQYVDEMGTLQQTAQGTSQFVQGARNPDTPLRNADKILFVIGASFGDTWRQNAASDCEESPKLMPPRG